MLISESLDIKTFSPFFIKPIANLIVGAVEKNYLKPNLESTFNFLESQIGSSPNNGKYLCGPQLTGADIVMSFPLVAARGRAGFTKEKSPKLWEYVERLESTDGYKKAADKIIAAKGSFSPNI